MCHGLSLGNWIRLLLSVLIGLLVAEGLLRAAHWTLTLIVCDTARATRLPPQRMHAHHLAKLIGLGHRAWYRCIRCATLANKRRRGSSVGPVLTRAHVPTDASHISHR